LFLCLLLCAAPLLAAALPAGAAVSRGRDLTLYTALTATTPQAPLWAAINGGWPGNGAVKAEYWKTLDDLRGILLAGKGDIWVGHLEGFAQAALRGAPVRLVAVTGWRKFYFITPGDAVAHDLEALAGELREAGVPLAVAPQDSPALAILDSIRQRGGPSFEVAAMQPQQLMLEMLRGTRRYALLPEPLVTSLLAKKPRLRVALGLEDEFARLYGGAARLPLAGVAVNAALADKEPELVRTLVAAMVTQAGRLAGDTEAVLASLPEAVRTTLGDAVIRASLRRDMVLAVPAAGAKEEIGAFLRMVLPESAARLPALLEGPFLLREK
jgi:NitT/TauT family transport system substrate-binding protein